MNNKIKVFKKITLVFFICQSLSCGLLFCESGQEALSYLDSISEQYNYLVNDIWEYIRTFSHSRNLLKIEVERRNLLSSIVKSIKQVKKIPVYDKNLHDAAVEFLETSYNILKDDYSRIAEMQKNSEKSYILMEEYLKAKEEANEKINSISEKLEKQVEKFAGKNNITLIKDNENQIIKNIKIANEVLNYSNEFFLIYFKVYIEEMKYFEALNNGDLNEFEKEYNILGDYTQEALNKLKSVKSYDSDNSLKQVCEEAIEFYIDETTLKYPVIRDYCDNKVKYESIEAEYKGMKKKEVTGEFIDKYNNVIKEYNNSVNLYNETIQLLNTERDKVITEFNAAYASFIDRHIPE